jgi:hypothetical protein
MTKRDLSHIPAIADRQAAEERMRAEAREWAKQRLEELVLNDETYTQRTAAEVLALLDSDPSQPSSYAWLNRSGKAEYDARYAMVRNHLEALARSKRVVCGTTINRNGVDGSTTYVRPRDILSKWNIEVDRDSRGSVARIVREFIVQFGSIIETAGTGEIWLTLKHKSEGGVNVHGNKRTDSDAGPAKAGRRPRATRGGS